MGPWEGGGRATLERSRRAFSRSSGSQRSSTSCSADTIFRSLPPAAVAAALAADEDAGGGGGGEGAPKEGPTERDGGRFAIGAGRGSGWGHWREGEEGPRRWTEVIRLLEAVCYEEQG